MMEKRRGSSLRPWISQPAVDTRASILIISLWSICLLTTFSLILGAGVRQKLAFVSRLEERDKLRFIAEAGIKEAISRLREEPEKSYDSPKDAWSNDSSSYRDIAVGDGGFTISYDYVDERTGRAELRYGLTDEESKININKASRTVLERLLRVGLGFDETGSQELAAAIVDWRDGDNELSIPLGSAEDSYYRNLEFPYEAKDADFQVLPEVLLVKGMDEGIFERIKGYITIYGSGKINVNTASKAVLLALGFRGDTADRIISFRLGEDGVIGTGDDNIFETSSNIVPRLSQSFHLSDSEISQLSVIADQHLVTRSDNFMVRCIAGLNGKKQTAEVVSVIDRDGKVLYWQES